MTSNELRRQDAEFLVLINAIDDKSSQAVHARPSYKWDEIVCGARFKNMYRRTRNGRMSIDLKRIHDIQKIDTPDSPDQTIWDFYSMSTAEAKEMTVLFADIAGSMELYSALGDVKAHNMVLRCLERMTFLVEKNQGRVTNTIGDEIMCAFEKAACALKAACEIQMALQSEYHHELNVRIGIHSGPTRMNNDHPFGDTVNIAARVVALAKAGQIMLSEQTCGRLSDADRSRTRHFNNVYIKGKRDP